MDNGNVTVGFDRNESLVLFEFLSRLFEKEHSQLFVHESEIKVLSNILGVLESKLSEPFSSNYSELLANARNSITFP
jgi:hypothetical protein